MRAGRSAANAGSAAKINTPTLTANARLLAFSAPLLWPCRRFGANTARCLVQKRHTRRRSPPLRTFPEDLMPAADNSRASSATKSPGRCRGFSRFVSPLSVARDHRATPIELVIEPARHLERLDLERLRDRHEHCGKGGDHAAVERLVAVPAVTRFDAEAPIVAERMFETAAERRAEQRLAVLGGGRREHGAGEIDEDREVGADLDVGEGRAAGDVEQRAVPGVAEACARRGLPVAPGGEAVADDERREGGRLHAG